MAGAFDAHQLHGNPRGFQFRFHFLGLRESHLLILIAMHQQKGWIVRGDVRHRRSLFIGAILRRVLRLSRRLAHAQKEIPVVAGKKIHRGRAGHHALHFGAFAFHWIGVRGVALAVQYAQHADQVPAGGSARRANPIRPNAEALRVMPDEADGALDVFHGSRVAEPRHRAVAHGKRCIARARQRFCI